MDLALSGGTIYRSPADEPIRGGTVVIRGGKIAEVGVVPVPDNARVIDCAGLTVTAGFWNSHVHFFERKWADAASIPDDELAAQLESFSRFGFTTVFDLGSSLENTQRIRDRAPSLHIFTTGEGLVTVGGNPPDIVLTMMGVIKTPLPEIASSADAVAAARRLLDAGADGIKLFGSIPSGAVAEAHRAGKPVFVHPNNTDDLLAACRDGVDVIAHTTPRSGPWTAEVIDAMENVALTPTLHLWKFYSRHDRISAQRKIVDTAIEQVRMFRLAGGAILFGTDLGAVDPDPTEEYELMRAAGMSFEEILASLTTAPAKRFGGSARVDEGLDADLVVFGDSFADVRYTIKSGRVVYPKSIPSG